MAANTTAFDEDATTLLGFADGRTIRAPSALLYDNYGNPLLTGSNGATVGGSFSAAGALFALQGLLQGTGTPGFVSAWPSAAFAGLLQTGVTNMPGVMPYGVAGTNLADAVRWANVFKNIAAQAVTAGTPVDIWAPGSGKSYRLLGFAVSLSVAGEVIFKDHGTPTEILRTPAMAAGVGLVAPPLGNGLLGLAPNNKLAIDVSASGTVNGFVFGIEE